MMPIGRAELEGETGLLPAPPAVDLQGRRHIDGMRSESGRGEAPAALPASLLLLPLLPPLLCLLETTRHQTHQ